MTVVYDLLGFQSRDHGERGIARYVLQLGLALERTHPGLVTEYLMHPELPFPAGAEPLLATGRVIRTDTAAESRRPSDGGVFIAGSPFECFNQPSSLVLPPFARAPQWRNVAVVHDLIPMIFPELYLRNVSDREYFSARVTALAGFDRFLANSQATADDTSELLEVDPSHITVIGAGADSRFTRPVGGAEHALAELLTSRSVPGLQAGYILFPTGMDPRKNIDRTIEAYGRLPRRTRRRHQLVLACRISDTDRETVAAMAHEAGVEDELLVTGYISDQLLCRLYQAAHLVIFPSYYEGFGLPALEAMNCGAPVICADASSLVEVQPLAEARFDPLSVPAITSALAGALADDELRDRLRRQPPSSFTWERAGQLTGDLVRELAKTVERNRSSRLVPAKPRLALFSPLPPQESGIATYTYRLLKHLRHRCDVTVFVDSEATDLQRPPGVTVEPIARFEAILDSGGAFDRVLYFIGNSRFHIGAIRTAERFPGAMLFHDVRLTELYREIHRLSPHELVDRSVGRTLASLYPERYRPDVEAMELISQETADRFGILMARKVALDAEEILVHSGYAASLLAIDAGVEAEIPFVMPCPEWSEREPAQVEATGSPIIGSFGVVAPSKQPQKLIAALPVIHRYAPGARVRFVGPIEDHYRAELADTAARCGVAGFVDFVGPLEAVDFTAAQRQVSIAVQLRAFSNGESSAAVAELMAHGVATVVTDLGSMADLPDDAVVKVGVGDAAELVGRRIGELLVDDHRRHRIADAAFDYATENSFARAADRLVDHLFRDDGGFRAELMDQLAPLRKAEEQTARDLAVVKRAGGSYLGAHTVLTGLFTGQKVFVDSRDISVAPALILDGRWEPETTEVLTGLLRPEHSFIDIGANVGYYGLVGGTIVDPQQGGSVLMIEANPNLADLIDKSIAASGLATVASVARYAVSDREGQVELQIPEHLWGSSYLGDFDENLQRVIEAAQHGPLKLDGVLTVPAVTLDQLLAEREIDRVDIIKMDIEGHEEKAYAGMAATIERNRDRLRLLLEFSAGQYQDSAGFFERIRSDFAVTRAVDPGSGELVDLTSHDDVLRLSAPGFVMLLAHN